MKIQKFNLAGRTCKSIMCWLYERKAVREPMIVMEEVLLFDRHFEAELVQFLPEYDVHKVCLSPHFFGYPASRHRMYYCLLLRERFYMDGNLEELIASWHCSCDLDGDALMVASAKQIARENEETRRRRPGFVAADLCGMSAASMARLDSHVQREEAERKKRKVTGDRCRMVNISQTGEQQMSE